MVWLLDIYLLNLHSYTSVRSSGLYESLCAIHVLGIYGIFHTWYGKNAFKKEYMVDTLLDVSLNHIETETAGTYINISRLHGISWRFRCLITYAHFNYSILVEKMSLIIYRETVVNEFWTSNFYSFYAHIIWSLVKIIAYYKQN